MNAVIKYANKTTGELLEIIAHQANQIQLLEETIRAYQYRQFAPKSEKLNPDQISLFNEAQLPKDPEKILAAEAQVQVAAYVRHPHGGRKALPRHLPRVARIYDLKEEEKICACGCIINLY